MAARSEPEHPRAIVLIGVSGSGKSTIGRRLAPSLGATFLEGDRYHAPSSVAKMRAGIPLGDADRWPWLDRLGRAMADHLRWGRPAVVACSALRRIHRTRLAKAARYPLVFIHLDASPKMLKTRMETRRHHFMPARLLRSQLATIEPLRGDECGTRIAASASAERTVEAVRRWLRRHDVPRRGPARFSSGRPCRRRACDPSAPARAPRGTKAACPRRGKSR